MRQSPTGRALPLAALLLTAAAGLVLAEGPTEAPAPASSREPAAEFQFVRLAYSTNRGNQWGRQVWQTDWPDAEYHFVNGISRLTHIAAAKDGRVLRALDDELFDYPWLYAVEVGYWSLDDAEAARLREYLLRGGFLMVDDFHGTWEWMSFLASLTKVFPDRNVVDIPEGDEVFHVMYDLDQRIQIPSRMFIYSGVTWERDGYTPHWRGIYDDDGRLMVAINFNMDIGDAWEHADWPDYPENMTALAYRFGINYLLYAMTH